MSLATQVLLGLAAGIATGVFFGELVEPIGIVGDAFIRLLQMTVLPYVSLSLILGIGRLSPREAGRLVARAGLVLVAIWALALVFVLAVPLAFPDWERATFFSTSMVESPAEVSFVEMYIPANPFSSLASGTVPAVVLFSIALGVALMGIADKQTIVATLDVAVAALSRVAQFVVRLAPLGVGAVAARAAGTLDVTELESLQVFLAAFVVLSVVMALWVLPALATGLTGLSYRELMGPARDALVTAFATGSVFVVLPILADRGKELVRRSAPESDEAPGAVDVLVPVAFNFPSPGTLFVLAFVLFAGWLADVPLGAARMPAFVASGLLSLFGSTMVAVPFLLDLLRIPADLFQLYVVSSVVTGRFAMLVAAVHVLVWGTVGACAMAGTLRPRWGRLGRAAVIATVLLVAGLTGTRAFFTHVIHHEYTADQTLANLDLMFPSVPVTEISEDELTPPAGEHTSALDRARDRGVLRVGWTSDRIPFAFRNSQGVVVGHDMDLANLLAADLGATLELVCVDRERMAEVLASGAVDLVMSGFVVTAERAARMDLSAPYMEETLAFVVPDHRRADFSSRASVQAMTGLRVAVPDLPYIVRKVDRYLTDATLVPISSLREFFDQPADELDALVLTAETGAVWTQLYPAFTVVIPQPDVVRLPLAFPVAPGDTRMREFLGSWIELKRLDGTLDRLYAYWILGRATERRGPRWSVIRDVLHWVE